jgi:hypothetical protein
MQALYLLGGVSIGSAVMALANYGPAEWTFLLVAGLVLPILAACMEYYK